MRILPIFTHATAMAATVAANAVPQQTKALNVRQSGPANGAPPEKADVLGPRNSTVNLQAASLEKREAADGNGGSHPHGQLSKGEKALIYGCIFAPQVAAIPGWLLGAAAGGAVGAVVAGSAGAEAGGALGGYLGAAGAGGATLGSCIVGGLNLRSERQNREHRESCSELSLAPVSDASPQTVTVTVTKSEASAA